VSKVLTVEHSAKVDCIHAKPTHVDGRAKVKSFGKRQINVVGPSLVDSTGVPAPVNAIASPSSSSPPPAVSVIGVTAIPAGQSSASVTSSSPPSASSSVAAPPVVSVIGVSNRPASVVPEAPGNAAPAPSSSGAPPPVNVIGTSFVTATNGVPPQASSSGDSSYGSYEPATTSVDSNATTTSTSCTETPTEMPSETQTSMESEVTTSTMYMGDGQDEEPCEDTMDPEEHQSMHDTSMPPETITVTSYTTLPAATQSAANTDVIHYTVMDDMVNAANSMFKAWNPYSPQYTPST